MTDQVEVNDEGDALDVLQRLVEQIRDSGYRDTLGHPLKMNLAYCDALALLELHGRLKR